MSEAPASSRLGSIGLKVWQYGRNAALSAAEYVTPVRRLPCSLPGCTSACAKRLLHVCEACGLLLS
jgi:hypothetical protein